MVNDDDSQEEEDKVSNQMKTPALHKPSHCYPATHQCRGIGAEA